MKKLFLFLFLASLSLLGHAGNLQQLLQLADYVGVDYAGAVDHGNIINESEYHEMRDFSTAVREHVSTLPTSPDKQRLAELGELLAQQVGQRADAARVKSTAAQIRQLLIASYNIEVAPRHAPDPGQAAALFSQQCAGCHGTYGHGDGPMAATLDPAPTDFLDAGRARERSLLGLYTTITRGVEGTAMPAHAQLSEEARWGLAFYVGSLWADQGMQTRGVAVLQAGTAPTELLRLDTQTTLSPAEIGSRFGSDGVAVSAALRSQPALLFTAAEAHPLDFSAQRLAESVAQYRAGQQDSAYRLAIEAYLEGFELVEGNLDAVAPKLRRQIEGEMTDYRNLIRHRAPLVTVETAARHIQNLIATAKQRMNTTTLSGASAFASSAIILLREGLEALLVIAALAAVLIKTGRRDGLHYLYAGTGAALALGGLTWLASNTVIDISGQQRELTEGLAALFAAAMLFVVGFWMHSKTSATQWKAFIDASIKKHLSQGTLWGIAGLAFIAVYREIFEVVLFYQALWMQADQSGHGMIVTGLLSGAAVLLILGWLILRFSARLPLRQFFAASGIFMFVLAFVFAGKGIAALQEAGRLPINSLNLPQIDLLGIYPNVESLSVQAAILIITVILLRRDKASA